MFIYCKAIWAKQKKRKENHATKVTKIPTTKRRKYGMNKTQVQLAAFNRICPKSLSIASIPYAQKHSHIAWQKVGLYQEGEEPRENAWSPLLLLDQPFSFLKISSKYNSTRELDLSSQASPASEGQASCRQFCPAAGWCITFSRHPRKLP